MPSFEINEPLYGYLSYLLFVYNLVWLFLGEDRKRRDFTLHGKLILLLLKLAIEMYELRCAVLNFFNIFASISISVSRYLNLVLKNSPNEIKQNK